jgi:hypothetical protein
MKSTRERVTPVPAIAVAVKDTILLTVAPGEVNETEDGVVIPPVAPPVIPPVIPPIVYMLPPLPPHAASIATNIPIAPNIVPFVTLH